MKNMISNCVLSSALVFVVPEIAAAQLFGTNGLDPSFCQIKPIRKTVVYVDDSMMIEAHTEWATKISDKLKATLTPGEPVAVVRLSPASGQSAELWSGCWPNYTADQRTEIANQKYIFSKSPLDQLGDQQTFFMAGFGGALSKIYEDAKRPESDTRVDSKKPPQKQLLRSIASDEGRYSNSKVTIRAIIYSDMMESSDLGSAFTPLPNPAPNYAEKLGSRVRRGVFYAFGVASDIPNGPSLQENAKAFWISTLKNMSGVVSGFGSDLSVANNIPVKIYNYDIDFNDNGEELDGKMLLLADADGTLVDSWLSIVRLTNSGLTGAIKCQSTNCKLSADTTTSFVTENIPSEHLSMTGKIEQLTGQLGIAGGKASFQIKGTLAAD